MGKFILGIVVTLAVMYPSVTKHYVNSTIDLTHSVVIDILSKSKREEMGLDENERLVDQ